MNPIKVFGVLAALMAAIAAFALTNRAPEPTASPAQASTPSVDVSLTDAEAIARFKELKQLRDRAYRDRDPDLIDRLFTNSSPLAAIGKKEVRTLIRDDVLDRTTFETIDVVVAQNTATKIKLTQTEIVRPRFVTEDGQVITTDAGPERQEVQWTLVFENSEWLVHDTVVIAAERLKEKR